MYRKKRIVGYDWDSRPFLSYELWQLEISGVIFFAWRAWNMRFYLGCFCCFYVFATSVGRVGVASVDSTNHKSFFSELLNLTHPAG